VPESAPAESAPAESALAESALANAVPPAVSVAGPALLGPAEVRRLAERLDLRPTKRLGQNFVHDANTVRRIARLAAPTADDVVLEIGPGLGSLTLALLAEHPGTRVLAVEIDPRLAEALPGTVAERSAGRGAGSGSGSSAHSNADGSAGSGADAAARLTVLLRDAMTLRAGHLPPGWPPPTTLVANLPYNVGVPVLLTALRELPSLARGLVMVQSEVVDRLAAGPGSRAYGAPSAKLAWYAAARRAGPVPRAVFWPVPGVDSALLEFTRRDPPPGDRDEVFALVDAAFAQRRKALRSALAGRFGSPAAAEAALRAAGIDPMARAEQLAVTDFARLAAAP
jgi:16S rRNA (adenine1518-N6/adenine1519-N6)-dimethyltransferase